MKGPRLDPSRDGLTVEYGPAGASIGRLPVAVAAGSGAATEEDLRVLLRRRLRFLCPLLAVLFGIAIVIHLSSGKPAALRTMSTWSFFAFFPITAIFAGLVWSRRPLSLGQLRAIELVLVAMLAARVVLRGYTAFWHIDFQTVFQTWHATGDDEPLLKQLHLSALFLCMPAAIYLVAYGVCIPNTWRRCVLVVGGLWSIVPVIWSVGCFLNDLPATWWFTSAIVGPLIMLTFAAATAVYGSHRIESLRHEALQARRLGQYILRKRLGGGGMGEVYLADHVLLRRPCAVKLIRPERAGDPAVLQRFEREVRATATLTHPNAIQIFDYGRAQTAPSTM